jgi:hypothetical protein
VWLRSQTANLILAYPFKFKMLFRSAIVEEACGSATIGKLFLDVYLSPQQAWSDLMPDRM